MTYATVVKILRFFNDTATTEIYPLSLHDALPISGGFRPAVVLAGADEQSTRHLSRLRCLDRKRTRLNSSHHSISYAGFCLKKRFGNLRFCGRYGVECRGRFEGARGVGG